MSKKLNSIELFQTQITNHSEELAQLLAAGPSQEIDPGTMERALLSTGMLAKSASLMEMEEFSALLSTFHELLSTYRDRSANWDERIAQVTSELIENEEQLLETDQANITTMVGGEQWLALQREIHEISPPESRSAAVPAAGGSPQPAPSVERPLGRSLEALREHTVALLEHWRVTPWDPKTLDRETLAGLRRRLFLLSFYAESIEHILAHKISDLTPPRIESLTPLRCAIEEYTRMLCDGEDRRVDCSFVGDQAVDSRLLSPVIRVLQHMITDTYRRCDDAELQVELVVQEQNGSLFWSVRDNGSSRVSDSPVDREEYLAFYPGLKEVRRILGGFHSLLWVEPSDNKGTRFSFSTPQTPDGGEFMVWTHDGGNFAVLPSEVGDIVTVEEANVRSDARGEFLVQNGQRVPLMRIGHLYEGAPSEGELIVIIGYLERRVAFYANGESRLATGTWIRDAVTAWKGLKGVAQVDDAKFPLIEAHDLLDRYAELISEDSEQGVAGGDNADLSDFSQAQAMDEEDTVSPPQNESGAVDADVLIVERSEALRSALATILSHKQLRARLVGQVEDAIDFLDQATPSVIISEFRVPSMAAKVLVERLKADGRSVPVLVTTTHQGANADLLVKKLGAAGYISKPLDRTQVLSRVDGLLDITRKAAGRT